MRSRKGLKPYERVRDRKRASKALGRPLKPSEHVHHHTIRQLVICQDVAYHWLLHRREWIVCNGGNPNTEHFCSFCEAIHPNAFQCSTPEPFDFPEFFRVEFWEADPYLTA